MLSNVYELQHQGLLQSAPEEKLRSWMDGTWSFLVSNSLGSDAACCFVLTREGMKKRDAATGRFDASIYADCFALIGMSAYIRVLHGTEQFPAAEFLYHSIRRRVAQGDFLTQPYPIPDGFCTHGIPMILLNTVHEYIRAKQALGLEIQEEAAYARQQLDWILTRLYDGNGHIFEYRRTEDNAPPKTVLERHLKPGHTLEDAWFWVEFLEEFGGLPERLPLIETIVRNTFSVGWDAEYGGVFCFVDYQGGPPRGTRFGGAQEQLVLDTWDTKLWWVHSELLYLFLKMFQVTGNPEYLEDYRISAEYAFRVFPDGETGEWIQIRRRDGAPEDRVVALPVKDPFHIIRDFIKIVELTNR